MDSHSRFKPVALPSGVLLVFLILVGAASAADWPTYRGNAARTGFVEGVVPTDLRLTWTHRAPAPPVPAWPRSDRMAFDRAFHTVIGDGAVYFGSSVDGAVRAVDLSSGEPRWSYYTEGPIRFAPVFWKDRIFTVSDDGFMYALSSKDGKLLWKKRGGPNQRFIMGNERLISKWPARGGPAVVGDVVYFAAGIWPSDGIHLYAVDANTGAEVWKNNDSGAIYMPQPHGGASAKSGVSAQGYLVASGEQLFVPTGRAVPAAFDRQDGKFKYFHLQKYGHNGGGPTMAIGEMFFNSGYSFDASSGAKIDSVRGGPLAATRDGIVQAGAGSLTLYQWQSVVKRDRKGKAVESKGLKQTGKVADVASGVGLIVVGDTIISSGEGRVDLADAKTSRVVKSFEVLGTPYSLAYGNGNLIVSTDRGLVYCFSKRDRLSSPLDTLASQKPVGGASYRLAADEIMRRTNEPAGYCLDLGCGDGGLAYELAQKTRLRIYAVEDTPEAVETARRNLIAAGVYGTRVTVHLRDLSDTGFPKYFANLVVSGRSVTDRTNKPTDEMKRLQRPFGGIVCLGPAEGMTMDRRGALKGAGSWTHQYANAANTLNSDDALVKGRLGMLWFRDVNIDIPQRHGRAPAPLFSRGRLLHQGVDGVVAVDAYNGREIWRYDVKGLLAAYNGDELMGTAGTGSNFCVYGDSVFIRDGGRCLQLDAATGTLRREILPPRRKGEPTQWGYIACVDGLLYGTVANEEHIVTYRYRATTGDMSKLLTESRSMFAIDADSGELLWEFDARDSIRHNAIAIGGGRVFLIDRPLAKFDREKRPKEKEHPMGRIVALDAKTGKERWTATEDIYGTMLAFSEGHDALLMSYQPTRFRLDSEVGGRMSAFHGATGIRLWDLKANYQSRPMINDRTIYAQGGSWDLLTAEPRPFDFSRSYGCGILAGGRNLMLFRSATLGYYDLEAGKTTENFGGIRPGCWVNTIPAGGVVLVPDASAGCQCSYLNKAWFALESLPD